jgi:hypothetical protein
MALHKFDTIQLDVPKGKYKKNTYGTYLLSHRCIFSPVAVFDGPAPQTVNYGSSPAQFVL